MCFGIHFNVKKYSTLIGSLICLIGCAYQIYGISHDYLSNETITKRLLNPSSDLPGLTICVSKIYAILNNSRILDGKGNSSLDLINDLNITEQYNHSRKYSDIVSDCKVPTANNSFAHCSEVSEKIYYLAVKIKNLPSKVYTIREYLTLKEECIIFFNQTQNKHPYQIEFRENRPLNLKINKKVARKQITFTVHSDNTTFDHFKHNFIKLSTHKYSKNKVTYSNINIESLPPPFKTKCTNYREYSFKTKGNCVRECLIKSYENIYKKWPPNVLVRHSNLQFATYKIDQKRNNKSNETRKPQRTLCEEKCNLGRPCYQQMFEPIVISEIEQLVRKTETFELLIIPPPYIIHFKYEIKTPMIHFLCYIASTVNLWLGVSAFPLVKFLFNMKGINSNEESSIKCDEVNNNSFINYDPTNFITLNKNNLTNNIITNFTIDESCSNKPLTKYVFQNNDEY